MPADSELLFGNGTVFDGYRFLPEGTAVRVRGGQITAVDAAAAAGRATVVDLAGGTLLPGFIDAHAHPVAAGEQLRRCDLTAARSLPEYLDIIAGVRPQPSRRELDHRRRLVDGGLPRRGSDGRAAGQPRSRSSGLPAQPGWSRRVGQ